MQRFIYLRWKQPGSIDFKLGTEKNETFVTERIIQIICYYHQEFFYQFEDALQDKIPIACVYIGLAHKSGPIENIMYFTNKNNR